MTSRNGALANGVQRRLKAYFLPYFEGSNPYMNQLVKALGAEGVEVCGDADAHSRVRFLGRVVRRRIDVIHLHWLWGIAAASRTKSLARLALFLLEIAIARGLGIRIVFTAHNLKPHESVQPRLDLFCTKAVIRLSHRTIIHGDSARDVLRRELRLRDRDVEKMVTVHHGHYAGLYPDDQSKEEARRQLGIGEGDFVFSNLGEIRPYKGILSLVDAFKRIEGDAVRLILAGRPRNEAFQREIEQRVAGDSRILFFPGFVPEEEVQTFVKASDVMVFPFEDLLSSGSVILGLSFARTCVAPAAGCITDVVCADDGYLYLPSDPDGLLAALQRAIADRQNAGRKGARSRERALTWTWEVVGQQTAAVYRETLHSS
jgi:glycosyltransferase involved in cell wall biosynthesis